MSFSKKITALSLCLLLFTVASLTGCGGKKMPSESLSSSAPTEEKGEADSLDLAYVLNDDATAYILVGVGRCEDNDVLIGATYKGLPVTAIGSYAFADYHDLSSVTISDSVTEIGEKAFSSCVNLTCVTVGRGVKVIGDSAFENCESLTNINYRGTEEEWSRIEKGGNWDADAGDYMVNYHYMGQ